MPAKTTRKLVKVGGSKAVALPPDWLRALKLELGDVLEVFYDSVVLIKPKGMKLSTEFLKRELDILAELEGG